MLEKALINHMEDDRDNYYFMINPYFPTKKMISELSSRIKHLITYYPSSQKIISEKIKKLEKIEMPLIALNGSCEGIKIFMQNFTQKALVTVPNFNEWEITEHVNIAYNASKEEICEIIIAENVDTVCFTNPNNPTGFYREDIEYLASQFPHVNFVIDASFIDFVSTEIPDLPKGKNIIIFKSLGKNYGICGIRLGYMASENEELIEAVNKMVPIWNVNSVSEFIIDQIANNYPYYEESRVKIIEGTQKMYKLLKQIDYLEVFPTHANFVMVKSKKIINLNVKNCYNKTGLDDSYYRFAFNKDYKRLLEILGD